MGLDVRDLEESRIAELFAKMQAEAQQIAKPAERNSAFSKWSTTPALCDPRLRQIVADSAKQLNFSTKSLPSGATHDAQSMARHAPIGMIFIPSIGGISHAPQEFSRPEALLTVRMCCCAR